MRIIIIINTNRDGIMHIAADFDYHRPSRSTCFSVCMRLKVFFGLVSPRAFILNYGLLCGYWRTGLRITFAVTTVPFFFFLWIYSARVWYMCAGLVATFARYGRFIYWNLRTATFMYGFREGRIAEIRWHPSFSRSVHCPLVDSGELKLRVVFTRA